MSLFRILQVMKQNDKEENDKEEKKPTMTQ